MDTQNERHACPNRRFFDAVLRRDDASLRTDDEAKRFLAAMLEFLDEEKKQLLRRLTSPAENGMKRLDDTVNMLADVEESEHGLCAFLDHLCDARLEVGLMSRQLDKVLARVLEAAGLGEHLLELLQENRIPDQGPFAWMLLRLSRRTHDLFDKNTVYKDLAKLLARGANRWASALTAQLATAGLIDLAQRAGAQTRRQEHDNDHADFRRIQIMPTMEESMHVNPLLPPFSAVRAYSGEGEHGTGGQAGAKAQSLLREERYLDWLFRMYREDLVGSIRDTLRDSDKSHVLQFTSVRILGVGVDGSPAGPTVLRVRFSFPDDHALARSKSDKERAKYLRAHSKRLLANNTLVCIRFPRLAHFFGKVHRVDWTSVEQDPRKGIVLLTMPPDRLTHALTVAYSATERGVMLNAHDGYFAYEPVLHTLQNMVAVPFADELVHACEPREHDDDARAWRAREAELSDLLGDLDAQQQQAVARAMTQRISLIQGPPGTGKSFVGARIATLLRRLFPKETIHILCYTNHALDQFLEELVERDIKDFVRLGSGSKSEIAQGSRLPKAGGSLPHHLHRYRVELERMRARSQENVMALAEELRTAMGNDIPFDVAEPFLSADERAAFDAPFPRQRQRTPAPSDKALWSDWCAGRHWKGAAELSGAAAAVWKLSLRERRARLEQLRKEELVGPICEELDHELASVDDLAAQLRDLESLRQVETLQRVPLIASTATGAAMHQSLFAQAPPAFVIIEEAGELLEAHIVAALSRTSRKLIMIGDHKQLRPKLDQYRLRVESGAGHNFDISLFERLITAKYPYTTLSVQFRMHPDLSRVVREMTYPNLVDSEYVRTRAAVPIPMATRLAFVHHDHLEAKAERANLSKVNEAEADIVIRIVRHLVLHADGVNSSVAILTPYLGQLLVLREKLQKLDSALTVSVGQRDIADLARKGHELASRRRAETHLRSKTILLATIDNFQGEEADVVVASMVRSNARGDIGFLKEPERVNVLFSRARYAMVCVANVDTFCESSKRHPQSPWAKLLAAVKDRVFRGLPVRCQVHGKVGLVASEDDFSALYARNGCAHECSVDDPAMKDLVDNVAQGLQLHDRDAEIEHRERTSSDEPHVGAHGAGNSGKQRVRARVPTGDAECAISPRGSEHLPKVETAADCAGVSFESDKGSFIDGRCVDSVVKWNRTAEVETGLHAEQRDRRSVSQSDAANGLQAARSAQRAAAQVPDDTKLRWSDIADQINDETEICEGATAKVYRITYRGEKLAVKLSHLRRNNKRDIDNFYREVKTMLKVPADPNVLPLRFVVADRSHLALLLPLGEPLDDVADDVRDDHSALLRLLLGTAKGLLHLHSHDCIHRDVKASNVIVVVDKDGRYVPKIADFGAAKLMQSLSLTTTSTARTAACTVLYASPEQLQKPGSRTFNITSKSDMWAFGNLVNEVWDGARPYEDMGLVDGAYLREQIATGALRPAPSDALPPQLRDMVAKCFELDPSDRPSARDAVRVLSDVLVGSPEDIMDA